MAREVSFFSSGHSNILKESLWSQTDLVSNTESLILIWDTYKMK